MRLFSKIYFPVILLLLSPGAEAKELLEELKCLQKAYPAQIKTVGKEVIIWKDGTSMPVQSGKLNKTEEEKLQAPALLDQIHEVYYPWGKPSSTQTFRPKGDPGRIRYEPFFRKMYGNSPEEVKKHLTTLYWMPKTFGKSYPLQITTINGVNEKLKQISADLDELVVIHPELRSFLDHPGGTFQWRQIANSNRLSPHSFGMTIDINSGTSNYWQWDLKKAGKPISEKSLFNYKNSIPWEIVLIFEKQGFIWGGKWKHYDSMHFEYRPELGACL